MEPLPALRPAVRLAFVFAAIKLALHIATNLWQTHLGYGYFRDELYYILCGRNLAWGYVDHGPIVALQARVALALFGHSLAGIRMLSALAGSTTVFLTGMLTWSLGGRRSAQSLAMLGVLLAPQYLGTDGYLSMNSFEPVFWMSSLLALILIWRRTMESDSLGEPSFAGVSSLWIAFGVSAGIGLLNKPSMTFFLVAVLAALMLTRARSILASRWALLAIVLLILIALPNLLWQVHHHWPTLEFLHNGQVQNKNIKLSPTDFLLTQLRNLNPLAGLVWIAGLIWLLRNPQAKAFRWIGIAYLLFLALMMALHAKDYYLAPIYPVLFAAGGLAWQSRFAKSRRVAADSAFGFPRFQTALICSAILILPLSIPVLAPTTWVAYTKATHLYGQTSNTENESSGPLPQFFADRFGWQEEADQVALIFHSLSPEEQAKAGILCSNYGEASAINFLTQGLPFATSPHNNYFLWGPHGATGEVLIVITGASREEMLKRYESVEIAGRMESPWTMPFEHRNIYLVRGRRSNLLSDWPKMKFYI